MWTFSFSFSVCQMRFVRWNFSWVQSASFSLSRFKLCVEFVWCSQIYVVCGISNCALNFCWCSQLLFVCLNSDSASNLFRAVSFNSQSKCEMCVGSVSCLSYTPRLIFAKLCGDVSMAAFEKMNRAARWRLGVFSIKGRAPGSKCQNIFKLYSQPVYCLKVLIKALLRVLNLQS